MKTRRFAALLLALVLAMSLSVPAYADSSTLEVTVQRGDTVYGICRTLGLDYNKCKSCIMELNDMQRESELGSIKAGEKLLFPVENPESSLNYDEEDVAYYIMPYKLKQGEYIGRIYYLWGLDYEDYMEDILGLNDLPDPDKIPIGKVLYLPTTKENLQNNNYVTVLGHVMQRGETVYEVVESFGFDYYEMEDTLVEYNFGADLTKFPAGERLLIPIL